MMIDASKVSLNTATVRVEWDLHEAIEGCLRHGIAGIAPWRDQVEAAGLDSVVRHIGEAGLRVTGLCRGGMFPVGSRVAAQKVIDDNRRAVDEAVALGADCLILVTGGMPEGSRDLAGARRQVQDGIAALLEYARPAAMPLAIEPLHPMYAADRACINTMAQANDLCDELGDGVGIAVDVYHVWWDPDLEHEIARAGRERILAFHLCDWLVPTKDLLLDRGMMGDGVIDIPLIRSWIERTGYEGFYEVEIMSRDDWWTRRPDEVLAVIKERMRTAV